MGLARQPARRDCLAQVAHLANTGGVGAIAAADEQSLRVEPENVSALGRAGCGDRAEQGEIMISSKGTIQRGRAAISAKAFFGSKKTPTRRPISLMPDCGGSATETCSGLMI